MDAFLSKHKRKIAGTLSCVDRIVFKGYLPISWADAFRDRIILSFPMVGKVDREWRESTRMVSHEGAQRSQRLRVVDAG